MTALPETFLKKIARSLEEEEVDIYVLMLYCLSGEDLNYFNLKDRERVRRIFQVLVDDTKHHVELLKLIIEMSVLDGKKAL